MSQKKKAIRETFRTTVFTRDGFQCRKCGWKPKEGSLGLDSHHIRDRHLFQNGGYVAENGITLCNDLAQQDNCHEKAEVFHQDGIGLEGYLPEDLYQLIGSSAEMAEKADLKND